MMGHEGSPVTDRTHALAASLAGIRMEHLGASGAERLETLIIDHLACVSCGSALPWGVTLADWARTFRGAGRSLVFGSSLRVPAFVAGLVNATAAHGLEYDDTHDASLSHPGAAVVATGLAVGAELGSPGGEVLCAIAAGYEATARVGRATGPSVLERGYHPTALFGGFGAATTAARLHRIGAQGLMDAWGLLLSMAGGSMQFSQDPRGTVVKRLHGGFAAQHGILAAQLAAKGMKGPSRALDGRYGLLALFGGDDRDERWLVPSAGDELAIHQISLKPYPCCRLFHSTIDALRDLLGSLPAEASGIGRLVVGGPRVLPMQHMMRRPASPMAAQYSLPFCLGAALVNGPFAEKSYTEAHLADPRVLAVADRVDCIADEGMESAFPEHFGTWIELHMADGRVLRRERLDSLGTPAFPMSRADVLQKFRRVVPDAVTLDPGDVEAAVVALRDDGSVLRLSDLFERPVTRPLD